MSLITGSSLSMGGAVANAVMGSSLLSLGGAYPFIKAERPSRSVVSKGFFEDNRRVGRQDRRHPKRQFDSNCEFTAMQCACAERLAVDPAECNAQGVYVNRTRQVSEQILAVLNLNDWEAVSPEVLENLMELNLSEQNITSLHKHDFDGLHHLSVLYLQNNQLKSLPDQLFDKIETILSELNTNGDLQEGMAESYLYIYGNPLVISSRLFHKFLTALPNFSVFYAELDIRHSHYTETVSVALGNSSVFLSDIKVFFQSGVNNHSVYYLHPSRYRRPDLDSPLTTIQQVFLCEYLQHYLNASESNLTAQLLASCNVGSPSTLFPIMMDTDDGKNMTGRCNGIDCSSTKVAIGMVGLLSVLSSLVIIVIIFATRGKINSSKQEASRKKSIETQKVASEMHDIQDSLCISARSDTDESLQVEDRYAPIQIKIEDMSSEAFTSKKTSKTVHELESLPIEPLSSAESSCHSVRKVFRRNSRKYSVHILSEESLRKIEELQERFESQK